MSVAASARNVEQLDVEAERRLAADAVVCAVVDDDVPQVARAALRDDRQRAEVHQRRAVAVETEHLSLGSLERDAERDLIRVTHAADRQKVALVRLVSLRAQLVQLATALASRANDNRSRRQLASRIT